MKNWILALLTAGLFLPLMAEDYGQQLKNSDFEAWEDDGGTMNEPVNWNSFATAKTGAFTGSAKTADQLESSTDVRPGSTGTKSAKIKARSILGVVANGNLTTGQINAEGPSATSERNHNATRSAEEKFHQEITSNPDSFTVWVKYNGSSEARVAALLHEDADVKDPYSVHTDTKGRIVTSAELNYSGNTWQRLSIPFSKKEGFEGTTPKFMLVSFSTNKNPGEGSNSDIVLIDDIVLVYNPTLATQSITPSSVKVTETENAEIKLAYTLEGTMSPSNIEDNSNKVKIQISDVNGNFPTNLNENILGEIETNTSGAVTGTIPTGYVPGIYKVRLVTTNYPMTDNAGAKELKISMFNLALNKNIEEGGTVEGEGEFGLGRDVEVKAIPEAGYRFVKWTNAAGDSLSDKAVYIYTMGAEDAVLTANFVQQHTLALSGTPEGAGSVTGTGVYDHATEVAVEAIPDEGYEFVKWINAAGDSLSDKMKYVFSLQGDETLVAQFKPLMFFVTLTKNIEEGGTVEGASNYEFGSEAVLQAVPSEGYRFVKWTDKDENLVSTNEQFIYKVAAKDTLFRAEFEIMQFTLTLKTADPALGSVGEGGTFDYGTIVPLEATPVAGYRLLGWFNEKGEKVSLTPEGGYKVTSNETLTAHFVDNEKVNVTLSSNYPEGVLLSGAGDYRLGTMQTIQAEAKTGYQFKKWIGVESQSETTENPYSFVVEADSAFIAYMEKLSYSVEAHVNSDKGGKVEGAGTYYYGDDVQLTAEPAEGYRFVSWTDSKGTIISRRSVLDYKVTDNYSVTANFEQIKVTLSLFSNNESYGTVIGGGTCNYGDTLEIEAVPELGYRFVDWTNGAGQLVSVKAIDSIEVKQNLSLTAYFELITFKIEASVGNDGQGGTVFGSGEYDYGETVKMEAVPQTGYQFVKWTDETGTLVSEESSFIVTVNESHAYVAYFAPQEYVVTVNSSNADFGSVEGGGSYAFGSQVQLRALENIGYEFVNWTTTSGTVLSEENPFTYTVIAGENTLTANFAIRRCLLALEVNDPFGGTVTGDGRFDYGSEQTIIAYPNEGYEFVGWTLEEDTVSYDSELKVRIEDDVTYTAHFKSFVSIDNTSNEILVCTDRNIVKLYNVPEKTRVQVISVSGVYQKIEEISGGQLTIPVEFEGVCILRLFGPWGEKIIKLNIEK